MFSLVQWEGHSSACQQTRNQGRWDHGHVPGGGLQGTLISLSFFQSLGLGSSVLEPDLDLGVSQLQILGNLETLLNSEVSPLLILLLQHSQLMVGEGCSWFSIRFVFLQGTFQRWDGNGRLH